MKELKIKEIEMNTRATAINSEIAAKRKSYLELEKDLRKDEEIIATSKAKKEQLTQRLDYIQACAKAASEQADKLNLETSAYKGKYIK
jgi:chromosome segregation ATPase